MADPWELILDHPYTGTPGVVFDHTPGQDSHGGGVNLADGDFLSDGASPGSGAVNFQPDSMIRVPATKSGAQRSQDFKPSVVGFERQNTPAAASDCRGGEHHETAPANVDH